MRFHMINRACDFGSDIDDPRSMEVVPEKSESLVRFVDVEKTYDGRTTVIERLNLDVRHGEFLTLLGPSGSGKTTCLLMLAGFESWTAGDILYQGRSLRSVPAYRRNIGVVFQNYALFPHMTVRENVSYPLKQRRVPRSAKAGRVDEALRMVELEGLAGRYPAQLSGGQQQRVALARALIFNPDLVLMDEPLGALDKRLREQMQVEIKRIHEAIGMTVVYVTHDQSEALTMSDRIAVFNRGCIEQIGSPKDLYERPKTSFVANFLGGNNNLEGVIVRCDDASCDVRISDGLTIMAQPVRYFSQGERVSISIRPELIATDPNSRKLDNLFWGTLENITYCGDHAILRCRIAGENSIDAKVPLSVYRVTPVACGDRVRLGWTTEDCWAHELLDGSTASVLQSVAG